MLSKLAKRVSGALISLDRSAKRALLFAIDLIVVSGAYVVQLAVRGESGWWPDFSRTDLLILVLLLGATSGVTLKLRIPDVRLKSYDIDVIGRIMLMAGVVSVANYLLHELAGAEQSVSALAMFFLLFLVLSGSIRGAMFKALQAMYRLHKERRRVLIYGAGTTGLQLARALTAHETIEPVAFVDDNPAIQGVRVSGLQVLRPVDIPEIVKEFSVDRVLLAMPSLTQPKQMRLARKLEAQGLEVQALPSFAQLIGEEELIDKMVQVPPAKLLGRKALQQSEGIGCAHLVGRNVLVSGGGGSIGLELCRQILNCKPSKLVIFDISELALYEAERALAPLVDADSTRIVSILGSVTEPRLVRRALLDHEINVVMHAAAYKHVPMVEQNPLVGMANNVLGTWTLGRAASDAGVERFMLISSDKAVRPTNIMGASKRLAEMVIQDLARRSTETVFAMVRFGNVLGSSGSVVPLFQEQIANGGPVTVTDPEMTRFFMTPKEAVSLVLLASSFAEGGEVFLLDMGRPMRIVELARQLIDNAGYTVRDEVDPDGDIEIRICGRREGEKLHEELLIGEGHQTTAHEKIFAAREVCLSELEIARAIRSLREAVAAGDDAAAREVARRWVDGYEPQAEASLA